MRLLVVVGVFLFASFASAEDKPLSGSWTKTANGFDLTFTFEKDKGKFTMKSGSDGCVMDFKYSKAKDGVVTCETTSFEKMGNFPKEIEKGFKFKFKLEVSGKTATVSKFEAKDIGDAEKEILEGEYKSK